MGAQWGRFMTFQEEQETFKKKIEENFISLFDLVAQVQEEQGINFNQANLFLLTRLADFFKYNHKSGEYERELIFYELPEPPFYEYSLKSIFREDVNDYLKFALNNGRFRSDKKAKKIGIFRGALEPQDEDEEKTPQDSTTNKRDKPYHPTERNTHLQMIAVLAEEVARLKGGKYFRKSNNKPNQLNIAELIAERAQEINIEALKENSVETYRARLKEVSQFFKGE